MKHINKWTKQEEEFAILDSDVSIMPWTTKNFGLFDKKGREIGVGYCINAETLRDFTEAEAAEYNEPWSAGKRAFPHRVMWAAPGVRYVLHTSAMRGGHSFGPAFNRTYHPSLEAAEKAIEKYVKGAMKRAEKEAAKAVRP